MNPRTTIIVGILLALLCGYAYWDSKHSETKQKQEEKAKTLLELKREDVGAIRLENNGQTIEIKSTGKDAWQIASPIQWRADEGSINRILTAVEKLKYKDVVDAQPKDLAQYALDKPKTVLHIVGKDGKTENKIFVGSKSPVDNVYYVRVNQDPRVFTADAEVAEASGISLMDLRDKKLTDFNSEKVQSVDIAKTGSELLFQKEGTTWKMKKPADWPASDSEITGLLSSFEFLRATQFIDQPAPDLKQYGLDLPTATVTLTLDKGLQQKVVFGKSENQQIYCRVEGSPVIAQVADSFTALFEKGPNDWREKKVLVFNRFDVEELHVKVDGKETAFKKDKDEKWTQISPSKVEVDADAVQSFMEKIETAEIENYGSEASIQGTPVLDISMSMKDWQNKVTQKHLAFGPVQADVQPVKNDDYSSVVIVQAALANDLKGLLSEIRPKSVSPESAPAKK